MLRVALMFVAGALYVPLAPVSPVPPPPPPHAASTKDAAAMAAARAAHLTRACIALPFISAEPSADKTPCTLSTTPVHVPDLPKGFVVCVTESSTMDGVRSRGLRRGPPVGRAAALREALMTPCNGSGQFRNAATTSASGLGEARGGASPRCVGPLTVASKDHYLAKAFCLTKPPARRAVRTSSIGTK